MKSQRVVLGLGPMVAFGLWLSPPPTTPTGPAPTAGSTRARTCPEELQGAWSGSLDVGRLFGVRLAIARQASGEFLVELGFDGDTERVRPWRQGDRLRFQSASRPVAFEMREPAAGQDLDLFVHAASHVTHVRVPETAEGAWAADWSHLDVPADRVRLDLYIERIPGEVAGGYFFFRDHRLPALFGEGLSCEGSAVRLRERNLGLRFEGRLDGREAPLRLVAHGPSASVPITFRRVPEEELPDLPDAPLLPPRGEGAERYGEGRPETLDDGWETALPSEEGLDPRVIADMVRAIVERDLTYTHGVLVARRGKLIVEEYFYGFDRETRHDTRSASKTLASTLVGLAIREGHIEGAASPALRYLPYRYYDNWDRAKARITLRDLLTMSSGLDANDYDRGSVASESAYQSQRTRPDWVKVALDAPMIAEPGAQPLYGGANPLILGGVLDAVVGEPLEWFAHRALFAPLGIRDYTWFTVPTGTLYLGGGMHLRPRDMLKLGQLYLDGGIWRGERILPEAWVEESLGRYGRLAPLDVNGHPYGYLWWHHRYAVGDAIIETVEARGAGGQHIFVVPALELVAVVTAGNFRNGRTRQSERVLGEFILPAVR